jgi:ribulose-phosphate 3-epimerase
MPNRDCLAALAASPPAILPSMLLCDFAHLEREVREVEAAGARALHLDVMDGHFVPNLTYGMPIVEAVRRLTDLPLDVHLMIESPQRYVASFVDAGADLLTIHAEAVDDPREVLQSIRDLGACAGLAINPATEVATIEPSIGLCDLVLAMSVAPGFGAQKFERSTLEKLRRLRSIVPPEVLLEVDGGVNTQTVADCAAAGAQLLVVGSAIFRRQGVDYSQSMSELVDLASPR